MLPGRPRRLRHLESRRRRRAGWRRRECRRGIMDGQVSAASPSSSRRDALRHRSGRRRGRALDRGGWTRCGSGGSWGHRHLLRAARAQAVTHNRTYEVRGSRDEALSSSGQGTRSPRRSGWRRVCGHRRSTDRARYHFLPQGVTSGGRLRVEMPGRQGYLIILDALTGRVSTNAWTYDPTQARGLHAPRVLVAMVILSVAVVTLIQRLRRLRLPAVQ